MSGSCIAGAPPTGGSGGGSSDPAAETGGSAGAESACKKGAVSANEVLVLGDSFLATNHQVTAFLEELARDASVLGAGDRYRDSSRLVRNALAHSGEGIADQYMSSAADTPVKVAIMNGGGADILLGSCDQPAAECPALVSAADAFVRLLGTMAADGVEDVVFIGYPDPVPEAPRQRMDVLRPLLEGACRESAVPCHWVDLREVFAGRYDEYILSDGLNPTQEGSLAAAQAVWRVMQSECIAQ